MNGTGLRLTQKQTQLLSRNLQQSLQVLNMSALDLRETVSDWLAENPFLEHDPFADAELSAEFLHEYVKPGDNPLDGYGTAADIWALLPERSDIIHTLHARVAELNIADEIAVCLHFLIGNLDEHGYLNEAPEILVENTPLAWRLGRAPLKQALALLQEMDPPGVGARSLNESLLLQLQALPENEQTRIAALLLREFPEGWQTDAKLKTTARSIAGCSYRQLQEAVSLIRSLNPFPFYGIRTDEPTAYVRPDLLLYPAQHGGWQIDRVGTTWPTLRINPGYVEYLKTEEVGIEIREKLQEAAAVVDSLKLREHTVLRLLRWIVRRQEAFLDGGKPFLRPLLMKDAARDLDLSESTISRAANQKYVACRHGIFPLRFFFSRPLVAGEDADGAPEREAVKQMIADAVAGENAEKPYSDTAISDMLAKRGIRLARRTVMKYRESLKIAPAHQRKKRT